MIKINLLPAYVLERHLVRRAAILVGAIIIVQLAAIGFAYMQINRTMAREKIGLDHWTEKAGEVASIQGQTMSERSSAGPYQAWVDWVAAMHTHNASWAWLYEEIARYVDNKVLIRTISLSGQSVTLTGATDSLEGAKRWYLNTLMCYLYSDVKLGVQVPGWSLAQRSVSPGAMGAGRFAAAGLGRPGGLAGIDLSTPPSEKTPVTLTCTLLPQFIIQPPAPPAVGAGVAGRGGFGGGPAAGPAVGGGAVGSMRFGGRGD